MKTKILSFLFTFSVFQGSIFGDVVSSSGHEVIVAVGVLQKQGISVYQYGDFRLVDNVGQTLYALKSSSLDLQRYVNMRVKIVGYAIDGYPLEGGPVFLEVTKVGVLGYNCNETTSSLVPTL